ncbi:hypothetical protein PGT21_033331 [Puccinia graminis f. sp. tritici]|uniref:Uncharacterized protein n=1 Tax=Puccinia graminis f. sp. tritici TaxID=56615 RepID=A0A5B0LKZ6_PUCGR|nr:hypothetical protein PGTUg99_011892 [Puccinia graminis f. sp. tritici]KAA1094949.1 hypothetical protein PGT21_033331 [Puccinia graminis f. sp. tritici]KAA1135460.1 hypothetical protein PGTUg99_027447 [Puccinia graminis f. sp. tritici]
MHFFISAIVILTVACKLAVSFPCNEIEKPKAACRVVVRSPRGYLFKLAYAKQNSNNKGDYYCELEPKKDVQFCCKPGVIEGFPPTAYPNFVDAGCTHITN